MTQTQLTERELCERTQRDPLLGMTIGDAFDQSVTRFPYREALVSRHQSVRYTWTQLRDVGKYLLAK